jgi:hypothetical protein
MTARDTITNLFTGWRTNNPLLMRSSVTSDFRILNSFAVDIGIESFVVVARYYQTAFPGWDLDVTFLCEYEDQVDILVHMSGTHLGPYPNLIPGRPAIPPTGNRFDVDDIPTTVTMREGKVALMTGNELTRQKADLLFEQLLAPPTHTSAS